MKFETWWRQMKPAEVDEHRAHFEDCWQSATEEAVRKEREACAHTQAVLASVTVLSLDAGRRAETALSEMLGVSGA